MIGLLIGKIIFLLLFVIYFWSSILNAVYKQTIPAIHVIFGSIGLVGFITVQWLI